ncbi:MAG: hypothetical protein M3O15_11535 [Acidobacteriota bacterium]|nr:hypothetical protein [Acidobacteriota bacterium]
MLRKILPVLVLGLLLGLSGPLPAPAQTPVTDLAHISLNAYWHYFHYLQFALQIYRQFQQLEAQYLEIQNQLQALRKLDHPNWREVASLLSDLDSLIRSGQSLGYTLAGLEGEFRTTFPGWVPWSDSNAYSHQTARALDTMRASLLTIARQSQSLAPGEQTLAAIRGQMGSTVGHEQQLELLTTLSGFDAQEQLLTRQSLAVMANLEAVSSAYWINREAQSQATFTDLVTRSAQSAYLDTSPGWTFTPSWWPFF